MKKTIVIFKSIMMIALMCVPFALVSCEKEEILGTFSYKVSVANANSENGLVNLEESGTILKIYTEELVPVHQLTGNSKECDAKVVSACKKAEAKISSNTYQYPYVICVRNVTLSKVIYEYKPNYIK